VIARLRLFVVLSRPPVLMLLVVYTATGLAAAGHAESRALLVRALIPVCGFLMFSVACNDLADERIDRVNLPGDPRRPLANGSARRADMRMVACVAALVACCGGLSLGVWPATVIAVGLCVGAGYSLPPTRLADRGAVASLVLPACYVAVPYLVGRLGAGSWPGGRESLLLAGLYVGFIGRILLKDFRDVRGDALFGKRTFLVRHGRAWTCRFSAVCWTLGTILIVLGTPGSADEDDEVAFGVVMAAFLLAALWLLRRLRADAHPRRESDLISATAIVGRGMLLTVLARMSMPQAHWPLPARLLTMGVLPLVILGQAAMMVRKGPIPRLYGPAVSERAEVPASRAGG
jgi:4-hydroxybenzoate polyprenyltransferase